MVGGWKIRFPLGKAHLLVLGSVSKDGDAYLKVKIDGTETKRYVGKRSSQTNM